MKHFFSAGLIERGTGKGYRLVMGYSEVTEDGTLYPWQTRREAQSEAKQEGAKIMFHETEDAARAALLGGTAHWMDVNP